MSRTRITVRQTTGSERAASASEEEESEDTGIHISSGSRDSDSVGGDYDFVDEIEPSDSASRPRTSPRHSSQNLPHVDHPHPPRRRHSQRAPPRHHTSIPHRPAPAPHPPPRPHNSPPDPEAFGYPDDYAPGPPPRAPYPSHHPSPEWQNVAHLPSTAASAMSFGRYPSPLENPFMVPPEPRLLTSAQDPYGYGGNPFAPSNHPFSGVASSLSTGPGAFYDAPYAPPPPPRERAYGRPHPPHRHSMYSVYPQDMDMVPYPQYIPQMPPQWHPYPPPRHTPSPPKAAQVPVTAAAPAPAAAPPPPPPPPPPEKKDDSEYKELKELLQKMEEDRIKREEEVRAKEQAQAEAKKKAEEAAAALEAAASNARKEAETKAEEEAKKTKEEADKALEEAKKATEEAAKDAEQAKKDLEAATAPKEEKPIKFKDAVGRKFSFPFHLCKTWKGMEELICQAFEHVDIIGYHVQERHYDLMGPNGEIILPQVWETVVQPDWNITMHLWPMEEEKPKHDPNAMPPGALPPDILAMDVGPAPHKKNKSKKGKDKFVPPAPPPPPMGPGPAGPSALDGLMMGPGVVPESGAVKGLKKEKKVTPMMSWMAGAGRKSGKGGKELEFLMATSGPGYGGQRMREPPRKVVATSEGICAVM